MTSRTRSALVKVTCAIRTGSMPWADNNTIWARRHVTTEPLLRLTIRSSRLPSSLEIVRTRTLAAMIAPRHTRRTPRGFAIHNNASCPRRGEGCRSRH